MHDKVKQLADSGDIRGVKYIFVDALDVDPTFERYQEDYEYCRNKGLFELHQELTPLTQDQRQWTMDYWVQLKTDLLKNLSEERLMHMREVAQVLKSDQLHRLTEERRLRKAEAERKMREESWQVNAAPQPSPTSKTQRETGKVGPKAKEENEKLQKARSANNLQQSAASDTSVEGDGFSVTPPNHRNVGKSQETLKNILPVAVAAVLLAIVVILVVTSNPGKVAAVVNIHQS